MSFLIQLKCFSCCLATYTNHMCCSLAVGRITKYGIVQWQSVYDDIVMAYMYCDTLPWQILYLNLWVDMGYFTGPVVLLLCLT